MKKTQTKWLILACLFSFASSGQVLSQGTALQKPDFLLSVGKRLAKEYKIEDTINGKVTQRDARLSDFCPVDTDKTARRIFAEYGAVFVSSSEVNIPSLCIFSNENDVRDFQNDPDSHATTAVIDGVNITLQKPAMDALSKARARAAQAGLRISPRGGSLAARRSYEDTRRLWNTRFLPGLNHWVSQGRLKKADADAAKGLPTDRQVAQVLEWEEKGIYFSLDFSKSILYSVAAPGASQHISMLAIDIQQFADKRVRDILAENGWFQTVKSDLPHFTYLGLTRDQLMPLGLKQVSVSGQDFWIPDLKE